MRLVGTIDMAEIMELERSGLSTEQAIDLVREKAKLDLGCAGDVVVERSDHHTGFDIIAI
ncbi:hypothetical protein GCM10007897_41480 [Sphingobium jiangsuense]|uniref:Putative TIM-barrel enzyme n=1 Tax=Sphingobium jiangsuense TaxID=870476 RepID=A0A7W6FRB9_9SPHN|nr:hypothetical protein [Sphingobium jiangsuense]MBB3927823.1 putative TIM-barrel enzyme [Sphingobium jiangsuense]GLT02726.1 hypothetical protein GCM10007897_41480 [Sphingobium jiangsuense]